MNRLELKELMPHRDPMLLIDEATVLSEGHTEGYTTIQGDEWFLQGHFPGNPIVPGVILCEMVAQTCCISVLEKGNTAIPYFAGMNKLRFRGVVRPGDTIRFDCHLTSSRPPFYFAKAKGYVNETECISGEFSFALKERS